MAYNDGKAESLLEKQLHDGPRARRRVTAVSIHHLIRDSSSSTLSFNRYFRSTNLSACPFRPCHLHLHTRTRRTEAEDGISAH